MAGTEWLIFGVVEKKYDPAIKDNRTVIRDALIRTSEIVAVQATASPPDQESAAFCRIFLRNGATFLVAGHFTEHLAYVWPEGREYYEE